MFNTYKAYVGSDYNRYGYVIVDPHNKTVLDASINPVSVPKKIYERKHLASIRALLGCIDKLQRMNIENVHIYMDSQFNIDVLNQKIDLKHFSHKYKFTAGVVTQRILCFNELKITYLFANPIKTFIVNNTSMENLQSEWDSIVNNGLKPLNSNNYAVIKEMPKIEPVSRISVYTIGRSNKMGYLIEKDGELIGQLIRSFNQTEESYKDVPHYLQTKAIYLALVYLKANNLNRATIYSSDVSLGGNSTHHSITNMKRELHELIEELNVNISYCNNDDNKAVQVGKNISRTFNSLVYEDSK